MVQQKGLKALRCCALRCVHNISVHNISDHHPMIYTSCVDHDYINGFCHADTTLARRFKLIKNFNIFPFFLRGYILFRFRCITDRQHFANTCYLITSTSTYKLNPDRRHHWTLWRSCCVFSKASTEAMFTCRARCTARSPPSSERAAWSCSRNQCPLREKAIPSNTLHRYIYHRRASQVIPTPKNICMKTAHTTEQMKRKEKYGSHM